MQKINKIAYLHGLKSNNQGPKNTWLRSISNKVYDPQIDYRKAYIYKKILTEITEFQPNFIAGSSMGGYFALHLAQQLNIPALLFNPALQSRSVEPDMTGFLNKNFTPQIFTVFGKNDQTVNHQDSIISLKKFNDYKIFDHGHRTPIEVFKTAILEFIEQVSGLK